MESNYVNFEAPERLKTAECLELNTFSQMNEWQTDYRQLETGNFSAWFDLYASENLRFTDQYCNRKMLASGHPPRGHAALLLPMNQRDKGIFNGKELGFNDAVFMSPSSESFYRTPSDLRMMVITVPISRLEQCMAINDGDKCLHPNTENQVVSLSSAQWSSLSTNIMRALELTRSPISQTSADIILKEIEDQTIGIINRTMNEAARPEVGARGRLNRLRYLSSAREFILENLCTPLSLETLARATGASPRSLETAFREVLNITVVQYIKVQRLNAFRHELLHGIPEETKVKDAAPKYGFHHLGHLARDYRALFNELPAETLRTPGSKIGTSCDPLLR
jgi:AraC-like DNA-binding protein